MRNIDIKEGTVLVPTSEPLNRRPKNYQGNRYFDYPVYGRRIDKITIIHPRKQVYGKRFYNIKGCRTVTTRPPEGNSAYVDIHAEHLDPEQMLWKGVHGAIQSIFRKGCYQHIAEANEYQPVPPEGFSHPKFLLFTDAFLGVVKTAKLHEVELAWDIYDFDIDIELLRECPEMSDEKYPGETFYSPIREVKSAGGTRLKNKSILAIYDKTIRLVRQGKLPKSALLSPHIFRIEIRMTTRYIERQIDVNRSIMDLGDPEKMIPDFLRMTPYEAMDSLATFSRRTIKRYVPFDDVWRNLAPNSELYKLLFD